VFPAVGSGIKSGKLLKAQGQVETGGEADLSGNFFEAQGGVFEEFACPAQSCVFKECHGRCTRFFLEKFGQPGT
jgi:hypothetical protein